MDVEAKLKAMGLVLPAPMRFPPTLRLSWSRVFGMVNSAPGFVGQAASSTASRT